MSISFGIQPTKKRKVAGPIAAFQAPELPSEETVAPALSPEDAVLQSQELQDLGNSQAASGRYSAALQSWDKALALTPSQGVLHELKAQVFLEVGKTWDALQSATAAIELQPEWADGFLTLAHAQRNFGEPEAALASMEEVLRLQPDHEEATAEIAEMRMLVLQRRQDPVQVSRRVLVSSQHEDKDCPD